MTNLSVTNLSVLVFAVSSMLSVGLANTLGKILEPLRSVRKVGRAVFANFVLVPLFTLVLLRLVPLEMPHAIGLFLVATAAGAPFLIKLVEAAEGDVPLSASLLVLLVPLTILYMPLVVPIAFPAADVRAGAIARPLLLSMLLPLAVGLLVRAKAERWALRLQPWMQKLSTLALVSMLADAADAEAAAGRAREFLAPLRQAVDAG